MGLTYLSSSFKQKGLPIRRVFPFEELVHQFSFHEFRRLRSKFTHFSEENMVNYTHFSEENQGDFTLFCPDFFSLLLENEENS